MMEHLTTRGSTALRSLAFAAAALTIGVAAEAKSERLHSRGLPQSLTYLKSKHTGVEATKLKAKLQCVLDSVGFRNIYKEQTKKRLSNELIYADSSIRELIFITNQFSANDRGIQLYSIDGHYLYHQNVIEKDRSYSTLAVFSVNVPLEKMHRVYEKLRSHECEAKEKKLNASLLDWLIGSAFADETAPAQSSDYGGGTSLESRLPTTDPSVVDHLLNSTWGCLQSFNDTYQFFIGRPFVAAVDGVVHPRQFWENSKAEAAALANMGQMISDFVTQTYSSVKDARNWPTEKWSRLWCHIGQGGIARLYIPKLVSGAGPNAMQAQIAEAIRLEDAKTLLRQVPLNLRPTARQVAEKFGASAKVELYDGTTKIPTVLETGKSYTAMVSDGKLLLGQNMPSIDIHPLPFKSFEVPITEFVETSKGVYVTRPILDSRGSHLSLYRASHPLPNGAKVSSSTIRSRTGSQSGSIRINEDGTIHISGFSRRVPNQDSANALERFIRENLTSDTLTITTAGRMSELLPE